MDKNLVLAMKIEAKYQSLKDRLDKYAGTARQDSMLETVETELEELLTEVKVIRQAAV